MSSPVARSDALGAAAVVPALLLREPYRLFFPLGLALAWVGVVPWLLFGLGALAAPPVLTHALVQVQGFMTCFVIGFLWTAVPRRTGTAPARPWQVAAAAAAVLAAVAGELAGRRGLAQASWLALLLLVAGFVVVRFAGRTAARRPPRSFVWLPAGFALALGGIASIGAYAALGEEWFALHELGRDLVLQGMLFSLVVGVGGMLLPLILRGEQAADMTRADRPLLFLHGAGLLALLASFALETWGQPRAGHLLRGLLALALLCGEARIHRRPTVPGAHRRLILASAWAIPAGYLWAAAQPQYASAALHVVLLGGYATMALAVGVHVVLSHGGASALLRGRPWQVTALAVCLGTALGLRVLAVLVPARQAVALGGAAAAFLLATLVWLALAAPWLARRP